MSNVVNRGNITPGCIYRIFLENFMTYKEVEIYPCTSLNLIIGPNGSGKSSFVTAIILGFAGDPSFTGREKDLSKYIKHNCTKATIEIEVYQKKGKRNLVIRRIINLSGPSRWMKNGVEITESAMKKIIRELNIQVDNLCQMLPQDNVHKLSELNPQELLKNTLLVTKGQNSVNILSELINIGEYKDEAKKQIDQTVKQISDLQIQSRMLSVNVDIMRQRIDTEEKKRVCEIKILWVEYQDLEEEVEARRAENRRCSKNVDKVKTKLVPLQKSLERDNIKMKEMDTKKITLGQKINEAENIIKETIENIKAKNYSFQEIETEYQEKLRSQENRHKKLLSARAKLQMFLSNKSSLEQSVGVASELQSQLGRLQEEKSQLNDDITSKENKISELSLDLQNLDQDINSTKNRIRNVQDVRKKRENKLRTINPDAHKALVWLGNNRNKFKHEVYEPIMMEINFTDPCYAKYLEATVKVRDLVAFTFLCRDDMNTFLYETRERQGWKGVNAVLGRRPLPPPEPRPLGHNGFHCYLLDTIQAPPAVTNFLCETYNVHRIPLGDQSTYENSDQVPSDIQYYYTANHKIISRISRYSNEHFKLVSQVRPASVLADTIDYEVLNELNTRLSNLEQQKNLKKLTLMSLEEELTPIKEHDKEKDEKMKRIKINIEKVTRVTDSIRIQERTIKEIVNEPKLDLEQEARARRDRYARAAAEQRRAHAGLAAALRDVHRHALDRKLLAVKLQIRRNAIVEKKRVLRELEQIFEKLMRKLKDKEKDLNTCHSQALAKLSKAKQCCDNKLPEDAGFPYAAQFEQLPSDLEELKNYKYELQTRMTGNPVDAQVIANYEKIQADIQELQAAEASMRARIANYQRHLNEVKTSWLDEVTKLVQDLNEKFSQMFEFAGCVGEVQLDTNDNPDDFSAYGICLMVQFRKGQPLMQFSRTAQSGGERAFTTALYLLAMQSLVAVPFRCVDEINQGMDAVNERKMLQLFMTETSCFMQSQCFITTPKLLPNLEYNDQVMVHTVMNGMKIMNYKCWDYDEFLEIARKRRRN